MERGTPWMDDNTVDPHPRDSMETGAVTLQ